MYQGLSIVHCVNYKYLIKFQPLYQLETAIENLGKYGVRKLTLLAGGKFIFWLDGTKIQSQVGLPICQDESWIRLTFLWWKYGFKMIKIPLFLHRVILCVVQHWLVLSHLLRLVIAHKTS